MACNECTECNDCTEDCGCAVEISSFSCVRYDGIDLPCIEVVTGDTLEAVIAKINEKICEVRTGIDGEDGTDGQAIDHVSYTAGAAAGAIAGIAGETDTYTVWGDVAETINLGTFVVYNGANGQDVDHTSFTSTSGAVLTAGEPGQTDTYTVWGDALETISLGTFLVTNGSSAINEYDSGWISLSDFSVTNNFGLPTYTSGSGHPKIRVIGKTVFLEGYLLLPLSSVAGGGTLIPDVTTYSTIHNTEVQVFTGTDGGYTEVTSGILRTVNPVIPADLTPSTRHLISTFEMTTRAVVDQRDQVGITLTTLFPNTYLNDDGKFEINTIEVTNDDALIGSYEHNSPYHALITVTVAGGYVPDYSGYYSGYAEIGLAEERLSPASASQYPSTFDGKVPSNLGGFRARFTTSYPLDENITQIEIEAAIALI